jgi:two-component system LytT family response regulator
VFLDIQMPGQDGMEVARAVAGETAPVIVFVTAFDQHTVEAFDVAAVDYVLKPYSDSRFHQAVDRAKRRCRGGDKAQLARAVDAALQALAGKKPASRNLAKVAGRIVVKVDGELHFVEMGDIRRISADGDFARLHLVNGSLYSRITLRELLEQLDPERFCRIHKSHIVNLAFIRHHRNDEQHGPILTLDDGCELPVGPSYKPDLSRRLF